MSGDTLGSIGETDGDGIDAVQCHRSVLKAHILGILHKKKLGLLVFRAADG